MNKHLKHIMCGALAVGLLASCNQKSKTFTLEGTISDEINDSVYVIYIGDADFKINPDGVPNDTIIVKDKKFSYSVDIDYPTFAVLRAILSDDSLNDGYEWVLVPGETAKIKFCNGPLEMDGTAFYQQVSNFKKMYKENDAQKRVDELMAEMQNNPSITQDSAWNAELNLAMQERSKTRIDYFTTHNSDEGTLVYAFIYSDEIFSAKKLFDTIAAPEVRNGRFSHFIDVIIESEKEQAAAMERFAESEKNTAVGKMFTDFEVECNGKTQKLSDYVGKGQYVLVDFWASWCGPCRAEIPNLINVYNNYKDKNLNVVGVTVRDGVEASKGAMDELGINYPQILGENNTSAAEMYGVMYIPQIILFGPDGTILERGLSGDGIEITVKKYLGL
ncbi:MAG: AhpC/TSA family protein [Salinivirgaceae bacterium]|nr:AhpC/TSA family protein [Salinivirgaceae bacterium]